MCINDGPCYYFVRLPYRGSVWLVTFVCFRANVRGSVAALPCAKLKISAYRNIWRQNREKKKKIEKRDSSKTAYLPLLILLLLLFSRPSNNIIQLRTVRQRTTAWEAANPRRPLKEVRVLFMKSAAPVTRLQTFRYDATGYFGAGRAARQDVLSDDDFGERKDV